MGRRQTALPPEKSKSLRVLCGVFGVSVPFVSVCLLVSFHQCFFYVRSPVENLAAYLCVRQNTVVAVVLQGSPAHFQQVCHFLVCQQFIAIGRRLPFLQQLFEQGQQPVEDGCCFSSNFSSRASSLSKFEWNAFTHSWSFSLISLLIRV